MMLIMAAIPPRIILRLQVAIEAKIHRNAKTSLSIRA